MLALRENKAAKPRRAKPGSSRLRAALRSPDALTSLAPVLMGLVFAPQQRRWKVRVSRASRKWPHHTPSGVTWFRLSPQLPLTLRVPDLGGWPHPPASSCGGSGSGPEGTWRWPWRVRGPQAVGSEREPRAAGRTSAARPHASSLYDACCWCGASAGDPGEQSASLRRPVAGGELVSPAPRPALSCGRQPREGAWATPAGPGRGPWGSGLSTRSARTCPRTTRSRPCLRPDVLRGEGLVAGLAVEGAGVCRRQPCVRLLGGLPGRRLRRVGHRQRGGNREPLSKGDAPPTTLVPWEQVFSPQGQTSRATGEEGASALCVCRMTARGSCRGGGCRLWLPRAGRGDLGTCASSHSPG